VSFVFDETPTLIDMQGHDLFVVTNYEFVEGIEDSLGQVVYVSRWMRPRVATADLNVNRLGVCRPFPSSK
jgi:hypothetical protein